MINKNMNCKNRPFILSPVSKDYLWGGTKLKEEFSKTIEETPLAESWECSTHPDGINIVKDGIFAGKDLRTVLIEHPEFLGTHPKTKDELPILIKFIDAKEKLSVQVHPDDDYARKYENGSLGKMELWYVVDAKPDAELIYGFHRDVDKEIVQNSLEKGTIEKYLQKIRVKKDDIFFIEPGTVHAIGEGILIAEIQESSNLTYRLYDYDRRDKNGKKRELHIDKALEVINYKGGVQPRQPMRFLQYAPGCATEFLCRCQYFQVERMLINNKDIKNEFFIETGSNSFQVLLCLEGEAALIDDLGDNLRFKKGDCIFIPADSVRLKLRGKAQIIKVGC